MLVLPLGQICANSEVEFEPVHSLILSSAGKLVEPSRTDPHTLICGHPSYPLPCGFSMPQKGPGPFIGHWRVMGKFFFCGTVYHPSGRYGTTQQFVGFLPTNRIITILRQPPGSSLCAAAQVSSSRKRDGVLLKSALRIIS